MHKSRTALDASTAIKYAAHLLFPVLLFLWGVLGKKALSVSVLEFLLLLLVVEILFPRTKGGAWIGGSLLLFVRSVQYLSLLYANTYVSLQMLTNIRSVEALGGHAATYAGSVLFAGILSFLPVRPIPSIAKNKRALLLLAAISIVPVWRLRALKYSPLCATASLCADGMSVARLRVRLGSGDVNIESFGWHRKSGADDDTDANIDGGGV